MAALTALAPAKVNLFLHVGPVDEDGYHPLASLVAFADVGDEITVSPADGLSLTVRGPFAADLGGEGDNLILRALRALGAAAGIGEPGLAVELNKQLPIAAGLGGGSSDAGAALKLARTMLGLELHDVALAEISKAVGADGPMCLHARAAWAEGRGDVLSFEPRLPPLYAVLINPRTPSPTGAVYRAYDLAARGQADRPPPPAAWSAGPVIDWLSGQRNDLEAPAVQETPEIGRVLAEARGLPEVRLVRMSGSGATVFAVFNTSRSADAAAEAIRHAHPDWWVSSTVLS
ncbi:MAG: 4-(cytidine 5'-diphospho)-2-C-methyl-D-erythritol kinase [Brevundimonas sp.]|nr:MAG: 4-(cytidine 5'-diphospho)-2-C-methyl-D-erythritol kinase [Brevundimonas sp.]